MTKKYEYEGLVYCDDDLSEEIDNYGGNLLDLYYALKSDRLVEEYTFYSINDGEVDQYETPEDLIENEYENLGIEVTENE